jgi:type IV secretion system protein TrbL
MCIPIVDPDCNPVTDIVGNVMSTMLDGLAVETSKAAEWAIKTLVTGWLMTPSPIMDNQDVVNNLRDYTYWYVTAIAVFSLLVAAGRMAIERTGKSAADAASGLFKLVLVTALAVPLTIMLTEAGDAYARFIINQAVGDGLGDRIAAFAPVVGNNGLVVLAALTIAGICLIVSFVQIFISIAIGGLKVFLCGLAPLPAAANIAGGGKTTLAKYLSWLVAALLYKPVAATIYAMAFWMVGTGNSAETVLTGMVFIAMAIVAMPALLRLLSPIAAQMAGGGSAGGGAAAAAGVASVATGAVRLGGARSQGGGGQGPASAAPSGGGGGAPPRRAPASIGTGAGSPGSAAGGGSGPGGANPSGGGAVPAGGRAAAAGGGGAAAAPGGAAAAGGGAAAGGAAGGSAAAGGAAGGAAAAAGPIGAAVALGAAAAKAGPAVVRKVGGTASGAAGRGEE